MSLDVCRCGRVERVHPLRDCHQFRSSSDPATATEAARSRQVEQARLERVARTALSARHYDELLGAAYALLDHEKGKP